MLYDYECESCGVIEIDKDMDDPDPKICPKCKSKLTRIFGCNVMQGNRPPWTYKDALKYKTCSFNGGPKVKIDPKKHGDVGSWNSPGEVVK